MWSSDPVRASLRAGHASTRRRALRWAALAPLTALGACGFKLRGSAQLPFETLYAGFLPSSAIGGDFRRLVRVLGGTRPVDRPRRAGALDALQEIREKEIVGFSSTGRPREYQLRLRFTFKLTDVAKGVELIGPTEILLRREITTTDTQLVARAGRSAALPRMRPT
jgi:LPS-assembly lipoprotein